MVVKKYRTFEEAERDLWEMSPGEDYYRRAFAFLDSFASRFMGRFPRGVFKYRNFEEAQKDRDRWLLEG
ncbi:MAG TPA: hypothetical protein ENF44_00425 [Deltaproteobacteria bacterium]|nr:hypothetical protein [Deltaproteobacteria bacterium]